jgi:voltage-gated potassium channel
MRKIHLGSSSLWNPILVIVVMLYAFVIPVISSSWGRTPVRIGFTLIFISGLMSMEKRNWMILYLSISAFVMEWISIVLEWEIITDISRFLNILFFLFVIASLIREMATARVVTPRVIMASISGYLLLGIIYSVLIAGIIQRDPRAFNFPVAWNATEDGTKYLSDSLYYGFVTLASLGYGDFVPLKPYSRSLATLITISGQLYIATIIGILIGKFASSGSGQNRGN